MSIRIQQILQRECEGLVDVADPLGGSYLVEHLTRELEERAWAFFEQIQARGGFIASLDDGWLQQHAVENQFAESDALEAGDQAIVGVNCFTEDATPFEIDGFAGGADAWERGMKRLPRGRGGPQRTRLNPTHPPNP